MNAALNELKNAAIVNTLRSCQLFTGLPPTDLASIAAISNVKALGKDAYLFREGDPALGFYVIPRGAISVHRVSAAGKEQIIHVFRPGESFAEVALVSSQGYPADARALESSQVLLVQKGGHSRPAAATAGTRVAHAQFDEHPLARARWATGGPDTEGRGNQSRQLAGQTLPQAARGSAG
jgi:hypothetical protein